MKVQDDAVWKTAQGRLRDRLGAARLLPWVEEISIANVDRARGWATLEATSYDSAQSARKFEDAIATELANVLGLPRLRVRIQTRRSSARSSDRLPRIEAGESRRPRPASGRVARAAPLRRTLPDAAPTSSATEADALVDAGAFAPPGPGAAPAQPPPRGSLPPLELEPAIPDRRKTFASFFSGPGSEVAFRFAQAVVETPGDDGANPLFLHGGTSTGKSHLVQAVANALGARFPGRQTVYVSGERFATQFSIAVRSGLGARFRELYRSASALVVDDFQVIAGKPETEKELLHTLDDLIARRRPVVLASTLPPRRLSRLDPGLEGRLVRGVVLELKGPDEGTRERFVRAQAAALRLELDEPLLRSLAKRIERLDQLQGSLKRLDALARLEGTKLTPHVVEAALADVLRGRDEKPGPVAIGAFVAEALGLETTALQGSSRKPAVVRARQLAMALTRRLTTLTLREVGAHFGGRSCACVHFAHRKVALLRESDPRVRTTYEEALRRFS